MDVTYTLVTKDQNSTELDKARRDYIARRDMKLTSAGATKKFYAQAAGAYQKGEVSDSQYEADLDLINRGVCNGLAPSDQEAFKEVRDSIHRENKAFRIKRGLEKMSMNPTCEGFGSSAHALYQLTDNGKNITEEARELIATYKNIDVSHLDETDPVRKMRNNIVTRDYAPLFASVDAPGEKGPEFV
jgi:hypothetical protein